MKRERTLLILGLSILSPVLPLGCNSTHLGQRAAVTSQDSTLRTEASTGAAESPTVRWLLRDPNYTQWKKISSPSD